jgi:RNA polymerase sigma-70 factor (ECF subfamily)
VFAAALEACDRYEPTYAEATPWLYGIARNKLRDSRRRGRVEDATRRRLGFEPVALEDEDLLRVDELAAQGPGAMALVDELPAEQGEAIKARVIEGREYAELASDLGCSESVVRQRVSRGLARLRTRLLKEGQT